MKNLSKILLSLFLCFTIQSSKIPIAIKQIDSLSKYDIAKLKKITEQHSFDETGFSLDDCLYIAKKNKNTIEFIRNLQTNQVIGFLVSSANILEEYDKPFLNMEHLAFDKEIPQETQDLTLKRIFSRENYIGVVTNTKTTDLTYRELLARNGFSFRNSEENTTTNIFEVAYKLLNLKNS